MTQFSRGIRPRTLFISQPPAQLHYVDWGHQDAPAARAGPLAAATIAARLGLEANPKNSARDWQRRPATGPCAEHGDSAWSEDGEYPDPRLRL